MFKTLVPGAITSGQVLKQKNRPACSVRLCYEKFIKLLYYKVVLAKNAIYVHNRNNYQLLSLDLNLQKDLPLTDRVAIFTGIEVLL